MYMEHSFDKLIEDFGKVKFVKGDNRELTFFDVAGYPHYENVVSNILQFYLNTDNDKLHNFGNLWLNALLSIYNEKSGAISPVDDCYTLDVKREYSNGSDKRIDLLIDCDSFLVVVENKIYADIYNDLNLYTKMAGNYNKEIKDIRGIVLSLFPINDKKDVLDNANYVNITYDELFDYIENSYKTFDEGNKWQVYARDFIDNIKQLKGVVNMKFDQQWIQFVNENGEDINRFVEQYENDINSRLMLLRELNKTFDGIEGIDNHGVYNSSRETYISQYNDVILKDETDVCIETYVMKKYSSKDWERFNTIYTCVWVRGNKKYDFTELLKVLNPNKPKEENTEGWGRHFILNEMVLDDSFDIQRLKEIVLSFIETLIKSNL